jgi:hypothetical protein
MFNTVSKKVLVVTILLFLLAMGILCGYLLSNEILKLFLSGDEKFIYFLLMTEISNISTLTFVFFMLFEFVSPDSGELSKILRWLPIKPFERKISEILPTFINITACSMLIEVLIFIPPMFINRIYLGNIGAFLLCIFLQIIFCIMILMSVFNILYFLLSVVKTPFARNFAFTITGIVYMIYLAEFTLSLTDFLTSYEKFEYNPLTLASAVYLIFYNSSLGVNVNFFIFAAIVAAIVLIFVGSILLQSSARENTALKTFRFIKFSDSKFLSLVLKEIKLQYRNEENFLLALLLILGSVLLRLKFGYTTATFLMSISIGFLSSFPALNSFGSERKAIPVYRQIGVKSNIFSLSKLTGCICSSLILYTLISAIMFSAVNMLNILIGLAVLIYANNVLYFAGVLSPIDKDNAYMQGVLILIIILIALPAAYVINSIMQYSKMIALAGAAVVFAVLFIFTLKLVKVKWEF